MSEKIDPTELPSCSPSPAPLAERTGSDGIQIYQYVSENSVGILFSIIFTWLYLKLLCDSKWWKIISSLAVIPLFPMLVNLILWHNCWKHFDEGYREDANAWKLSEELLWELKFQVMPNYFILCLGLLVAALVRFLLKWSNVDSEVNVKLFGMFLTSFVAVTIFAVNSLKSKNDFDHDCTQSLGDDWDTLFYSGNIVNEFALTNLAYFLSEFFATVCFTLFVGIIYTKKKENQNEEQNLEPTQKTTSIYQELNRNPLEVIPIFFAQILLYAIYESSVARRETDKVQINAIYYSVAVLVLLRHIVMNNSIQEILDRAKFWANVLFFNSYKWDKDREECHTPGNLRIFLFFVADTWVNLTMLIAILVNLPYQASVDDRNDPVSFVLNLVGIFYVIGLDDISWDKQKDITFVFKALDEKDERADGKGEEAEGKDGEKADEKDGKIDVPLGDPSEPSDKNKKNIEKNKKSNSPKEGKEC